MNFSRIKVASFFVGLLILGWFLYPNAFFMGYIYEGTGDLHRVEAYYKRYLQKSPDNKFAALRLARLYDRMAEPQQATELLHNLYKRRSTDWEVATIYLDHVEQDGDLDTLRKTRLQVAKNFLHSPHVRKAQLEDLLYAALQDSLWLHENNAAYEILELLIQVARDPSSFREKIYALDLGLKKTKKVVATLQNKITSDPHNISDRTELVSIYTATGEFEAALQVLEDGLFLDQQNKMLLLKKASLLQNLHREGEALSLLQSLLRENLSEEYRKEALLQLIGLLDKTNHPRECLARLDDYLKLYPDSPEQEELKVGILLYKIKSPKELDLYQRYVQKYQKADVALDVTSLLIDLKKLDAAIAWGDWAAGLFPSNRKIRLALAEAHFSKKEYDPAIRLLQGLEHPTDEELMKLASCLAAAGQKDEALQTYLKLARLYPNRPKVLKEAGKEILFLGEARRGVSLLKTATELGPRDGEAFFWLAEGYGSLGNTSRSIRAYRQAGALLNNLRFKKGNLPNPEEERMLLKSLGKVAYNKNIGRAYQSRTGRDDKNLELRTDWIELLVENRQAATAKQEVRKALKDFPKAGNPLKAYQEVIRKNFDTRITPYFNIETLGVNKRMEWGTKISSFITGAWRGEALFEQGRYENTALGNINDTSKGSLKMTGPLTKKWGLMGGFELGHSLQRTTTTPTLGVAYQPSPGLKLASDYTYRALRTDLDEAITSGTLHDTAHFSWDFHPTGGVLNRFLLGQIALSGRYEFERNTTSAHHSALVHRIDSLATLILSQKPYLTLGYQYTWDHVSDQNLFLTEVPLVPKINAHYLTGYAEIPLHKKWLGQAGFFLGEDLARNLHLFEGDLWGIHAGLTWNALPELDLNAHYSFASENLSGITGKTHQGHLEFSVHWY